MPKASLRQRAYIAGLFDGEGYIGIHPHVNKSGRRGDSLRIVIKMCDKEGIDLAHHLYGGTIRYNFPKNPRWRGQYVWELGGRFKVEKFIHSILPFSLVKSDQLSMGIKFASTFRRWNRLGSAKGSMSFHGGKTLSINAVPKNIIRLRTKLCAKMKELKRAN